MSGAHHNRLAALAADIRSAHTGVRDAAKTAAEKAIEAGRALIEAKGLLKHGQWLPWLKEHCQLSERTAQLYMHIARLGLESASVADLGLKAAGQALWVIRDESYDPFAGCDEAAKREWLLFVLFGIRWAHVEWILQRPFSTVDEWLGDEGAEFRRRIRCAEPSEKFKADWIAFRKLRSGKPLAEIEAEAGALETQADRNAAHPARLTRRKRRRLRQGFSGSDRLEHMAAELRRSGWLVSPPEADAP